MLDMWCPLCGCVGLRHMCATVDIDACSQFDPPAWGSSFIPQLVRHSMHQLSKAKLFSLAQALGPHSCGTCFICPSALPASVGRHCVGIVSVALCLLCLQDPSEEVACEVEGGAATARLAWKWTCLAAAAAAGDSQTAVWHRPLLAGLHIGASRWQQSLTVLPAERHADCCAVVTIWCCCPAAHWQHQ
jgi:hypothetical protein